MAVARYHNTPSGPKLCSASIRSCPYGGSENHFESSNVAKKKFVEDTATAEQIFRSSQPASKMLSLTANQDHADQIVLSQAWGSTISDLIDQHIEATSVKPEQIDFLLYWDESSIDNDPAKARRYLFDATPRLDDSLGKFTNLYRLAWWNPKDEQAQKLVDNIYIDPKTHDARWSKVPERMKWEAAFGEIVTPPDSTKNSYLSEMGKELKAQEKNKADNRSILNSANVVDQEELAKKLYSSEQAAIAVVLDAKEKDQEPESTNLYLYQKSVERRASNIIDAIRATENSIIGPYNAYDRGIGFYSLDNDRRTIVDEELSSTYVRGRHLHQLGLDSANWIITGNLGGSKKDSLAVEGAQAKYSRAVKSTDKGIPYQSPMTFWTANTPDGARWELGLDVRSEEAGSHRVRYFEASNPNWITEDTPAAGPVEGFAAMRESMEARYGESSKWTPALQKDMRVLADIVEGHKVMSFSAASARKRMEENVKSQPAQEAKAEHNSLFGSLSKLFG